MSTQFSRYLLVGVASMIVDTGLLVLMRDGLAQPLWLATTVAFATVFVFNFGMNMRWVFAAESQLGRRLLRYCLLVVANYLITMAVVLGLSAMGFYYLFAKATAIALCVVLNFVAYRAWVFG